MFARAARNKVVPLLLAGVLCMAIINAGLLFYINWARNNYAADNNSVLAIDSLRGKLDDIETKLWEIISNPESKQTDIKDSSLYPLLDQMRITLAEGVRQTETVDARNRLYRIQRSMDALVMKIRSLEENQEDRVLDENDTEVFFPRAKRTTLMVASYVDRSERIFENFRISKDVINKNITDYISYSFRERAQRNEQIRYHFGIAVIAGSAAFIAAALLSFLCLWEWKAVPLSKSQKRDGLPAAKA